MSRQLSTASVILNGSSAVYAKVPFVLCRARLLANGGARAIIVRLYKKGAKAEKAALGKDNLNLEAASSGEWGNNLRIRIDDLVSGEVPKITVYRKPIFSTSTIQDTKTDEREVFLNLSIATAPVESTGF